MLLLPQGRAPLFCTFEHLGDPELLPGGWWACVCTRYCSLLHAREPCFCWALPSQPQLGTKVQDGIMGWGAQVAPLYIVLPWAKSNQPPSGEGWAVLKEEGDQCSNLPGTPPLPHIGPVQWAWGFPLRGPKAWAISGRSCLLTHSHLAMCTTPRCRLL